MRILLPPSEGKTAPRRGRPVDLERLVHPELAPQRRALLDAVQALCAGPADAALGALGLAPGQAGELERNRDLASAPSAPAAAVYSGVLYERLRLAELPAPARRRVLIASALWGVVRPGDRIPAYRLAIGARLPGIANLAAFWRPVLAQVLPDRGLIVDMRSSGYAAAWAPRRATVVAVRAFVEAPDGTRRPISHMAKRVRGDVARALLLAPAVPRTAGDVRDVVAAAGMRCELSETGLDVIESG